MTGWLTLVTLILSAPSQPSLQELVQSGGCTPPVFESINTETISFFWGSNVQGLGPSPPAEMKQSASEGANKWNDPTCNEGGDDFPGFNWTGWKPRGFDGNTDVTLAVRLWWVRNDSGLCAAYDPGAFRMRLWPSIRDNTGIERRCPAGLLMDDVEAGRDPRQTGSYYWFRDMVHHELGHSMGLGEVTAPFNGCAMTMGIRMDPQPPWNEPMIIKEGCATQNECETADQANSTNEELLDECNRHPLVCILGPPNPPNGDLPNGPDGPRPCGFPGGPGGFDGCGGPDLDSINEGPNPTYIELYRHTNNSVTVTCIEL